MSEQNGPLVRAEREVVWLQMSTVGIDWTDRSGHSLMRTA
jgi:hypothetical protein